MRFVKILCVVSVSGTQALADVCRDEIAALYSGGAMDPFARPPHIQHVQEQDAKGTTLRENTNYFQSPLRTIAGSTGNFTLAIDTDIWTGPTAEGPWTSMGGMLPIDRSEMMAEMVAQQAANLADAVCHGAGDDGRIHYTFRTQSDPDANGVYFGALHDIWVDPETGLVVAMEMTDFVNSWSEGISDDRHVIRFEYVPTLTVTAPE